MRRIVTILAVLAIIGLTMEPAFAGDRHRRQSQRDRSDRKMKVQVYHQSGPYVWVPQAYVAPRVPIIVRPMPVYRGYGYAHPQRHQQQYRYSTPRLYQPIPRRYYYPSSGFSIRFSW